MVEPPLFGGTVHGTQHGREREGNEGPVLIKGGSLEVSTLAEITHHSRTFRES